MNDGREVPRTSALATINRVALLLAIALFAGIGAWWWHDRTRHWEAPRWDRAGFVALRAPAPDSGARANWIVAVNPECASCRARLADLLRRDAAKAAGAKLGVLLVDTPRRPDSLEAPSPTRLEAGVWWDSLGAWRSRWGHRVYGETFVFAPDGALRRVIAPSEDPEAPPVR
jgi:hypothetical protein